MRHFSPIGLAIVAATLGLTAGSALAASAVQKACSEKYQAAKAGNTLNGQTYNQYYKQCAADAKAQPAATPATAPAAAPTTTAATPAETKAEKKAEKKQEREEKKAEKAAAKSGATPAAAPAPAPTATAAAPAPKTTSPTTSATVQKSPVAPSTSGATLPTAISPDFASQSPHLGRLHTCAAQWKANKTTNTNGTLTWPAYYSECNKRLKG